MKLRTTSADELHAIDGAIRLLKKARTLLIKADARRSIDKVRSAIKSAEGARRHAYRAYTEERCGKGVS